MFASRIRNYIGARKDKLAMAGAIAIVIFIIYTVFNLIIWNEVSLSYAIIFGVVGAAMYFVAMRLIRYLKKKKGEGKSA